LAFAVTAVPDKLTDAGDIAHAVPAGPPLQLSATVPVNPFTGVTVTVYVAFFPFTLCEDGDTETVKLPTLTGTADDVLPLKFESPLYTALSVRLAAVEKVMAQDPEGALPEQLSPVLA